MKKVKLLSVLLIATSLFSCKKEDVQPQQEVEQLDCNCDRVVSVNSFNLVSEEGQVKFYNYVTINDCTKIQKSGTVHYYPVKVGDCL